MQWSVDCYSSCCKTSVVHHVVVMGPCCGGWAMSCHIVRHKYTTRHHVSRVPTFDPPGVQDLATQYTYLIPETLQTSNVRHLASILWVSNYLTVALTLVSAASECYCQQKNLQYITVALQLYTPWGLLHMWEMQISAALLAKQALETCRGMTQAILVNKAAQCRPSPALKWSV